VIDAGKTDVMPWQRPGAERRDLEPDRGELLQWLGWAGLACGLATFCLLLPALAAFALGITVLVMARADLARMRAGLMDHAGEEQTRTARRNALCGLGLALVPLLILGSLSADRVPDLVRLLTPIIPRPSYNGPGCLPAGHVRGRPDGRIPAPPD
jgi:hypothetical protein